MATEEDILLPDIGDFDAVEIIEITVNIGDTVEAEDTLLTLESDKATMDIPSPKAGEIKQIKVNIGDKISEGTAIVSLLVNEGSSTKQTEPEQEDSKPVKQAKPEETETKPVEKVSTEDHKKTDSSSSQEKAAQRSAPDTLNVVQTKSHASPSVRRFARELGVDLGLLSGTGPKGRILKDDVKAYTKSVMSGARQSSSGSFALPEMPAVDFSKFGPIETKPLERLKRLSGQNLHRSWISVPHVTQFDEADITDLEEFRQSKKSEAEQHGTKLTLLSFLIKAAVVALKKYPEFNASLSSDGEALILKQYYHIGIAVNTDAGLMVPVVKDADQKGLFDLAKELATLAQKARDKKLTPKEM